MIPRREEIVDGNYRIDDYCTSNVKPTKKSETPIVTEQNGSFYLELGSYKALKLPLSLIIVTVCIYPYLWTFQTDPRMDGLPLMDNIFAVLGICFFYINFSLVWGPRYMANKPAYDLKKVKMAYNLFQVVISSYIFIQGGRLAWFWDYSYRCQPIDYSWDEIAFKSTRVVYVYFLTKILDLMDTVFMVLNKKWTQITLLHVFHHSCPLLGIYMGAKYQPGGHGTFFGFVNSFIHMLIYAYYFLAALGPSVRPYLWWKKYLTMIQLIQFVAIFFHALQVFFIDCPIHKSFQFFTCIYTGIFFYLFIDFYRHSYRKQTKKNVKVATNGISENKSNGIQSGKPNAVKKVTSSGYQCKSE